MSKNIYDFKVKSIDGKEVSLSNYKSKVLLVVNVASKCGLTPQYEGLEKIYEKYQDKGFEILAFPANEFLAQEPGSNEEIKSFCTMNFGVKFPLFEKIVVKGEGMHPLYQYLTTEKSQTEMKEGGSLIGRLKDKGLLSGKESDIKWNFEKFLISREGEIVHRFSPEFSPEDKEVISAIEAAL